MFYSKSLDHEGSIVLKAVTINVLPETEYRKIFS